MRPGFHLRRLVASALLVVYATLAAVGGSLVRCEELDGAVRIEWRSAGCCESAGPVAPRDVAETAASSETGEDCAGCTDESFVDSMSATKARESQASRVQAPEAPALLPSLLVPATAVWSRPDAQWTRSMRAPHPPPCLAGIRTVVLLS